MTALKMTSVSHKLEGGDSTVCFVEAAILTKHSEIVRVLGLQKPMWELGQHGGWVQNSDDEWTKEADGTWTRTVGSELLVVSPIKGLGWTACRNGALLLTTEGCEALFRSIAAAKTAAIVHVKDGHDDWAPIRDGLSWHEATELARAA